MALTDAIDVEGLIAEDIEKALGKVSGELRYLWSSNEIPERIMAGLQLSGFGTMDMFSGLSDDKAGVVTVMRAGFNIDDTVSLANKALVVKVWNAVNAAKKRRSKQDEVDAEARVSRLPKLLPRTDYGRMKMAFEGAHEELEEKLTPSKVLVERRLDMIEDDEPKAMRLEEISSVADPEDELLGAAFDAGGALRIKPKANELRLPQTPEELRTRHKIAAHSWIFAMYRAGSCRWLVDFDVGVYTKLSDYLLGEDVWGLEAKDASNKTIGRAPWGLVLSYRQAIEKKACRLVGSGLTLKKAMKAAMEDSVVKERNFTTPLAVSPKTLQQDGQARVVDTWQGSGSKGKKGSWGEKGSWGNRYSGGNDWSGGKTGRGGKWGRGKGGKSGGNKGTAKSRGKGKYKGKRFTPDGRPICFAFNGEGCPGPPACDRIHVCGLCFGDHSITACPNASA